MDMTLVRTTVKSPGMKRHVIADVCLYLNRSHSQETLATMRRYRVGRVQGSWVNFTPPIQGGTFRPLLAEEKDEDGIQPDNDDESLIESTDGVDSSSDAGASDTERSSVSSFTSVEEDGGLLEEKEQEQQHNGTQMRLRKKSSSPRTDQPLSSTDNTYTATAVQQEVDVDLLRYPSLDAETQRAITEKFQALHQRVRDEGFYDCRFSEYAKEMLRYSILFAGFLYCLHRGWIVASACFLGTFWQQIMFTAHDAGHRAITHDIVWDTLIGIFIGDFCCGLSIGWWKSSHNVHHLVTNSPVSITHPPPRNDYRANHTTRNTIPTSKTSLSSPPPPPFSPPSNPPTTTSLSPGTASPPSPCATRNTPTTPSWPWPASTSTFSPGRT